MVTAKCHHVNPHDPSTLCLMSGLCVCALYVIFIPLLWSYILYLRLVAFPSVVDEDGSSRLTSPLWQHFFLHHYSSYQALLGGDDTAGLLYPAPAVGCKHGRHLPGASLSAGHWPGANHSTQHQHNLHHWWVLQTLILSLKFVFRQLWHQWHGRWGGSSCGCSFYCLLG